MTRFLPIPEALAEGEQPIIYLAGLSRQELRAAELPSRIQPWIERQYRGRVWHQQNGRDCTVM